MKAIQKKYLLLASIMFDIKCFNYNIIIVLAEFKRYNWISIGGGSFTWYQFSTAIPKFAVSHVAAQGISALQVLLIVYLGTAGLARLLLQ